MNSTLFQSEKITQTVIHNGGFNVNTNYHPNYNKPSQNHILLYCLVA